MHLNADSDGFTLLEMVLTAVIVGALILWGAMAWRTNQRLWKQAFLRHTLEMEGGDAGDLLGGLLRRADPATVVIESSAEGPWSHLQFAAGGHHYAFYGERGVLWFCTDDLAPKSLSAHVIGIQFAAARSRLPTLLTWSLCLGERGAPPNSRVLFSATQLLERSPE